MHSRDLENFWKVFISKGILVLPFWFNRVLFEFWNFKILFRGFGKEIKNSVLQRSDRGWMETAAEIVLNVIKVMDDDMEDWVLVASSL